MRRIVRALFVGALSCFIVAPIQGGEKEDAIARGKKALLQRSFNPPVMRISGYDNAWKQWGLKQKPKDFTQRFLKRYGLHKAPYTNGRYPMGLREDRSLFGKGLTTDCLICHGGSICGQSYVGLGNSTFDYHLLTKELSAAGGSPAKPPFQFCQTRGTVEAGAMTVYLLSTRSSDLTLKLPPIDLGLKDNMCEDVPAWWLLKKKKTMYHTGGGNARSVRALMQFMMSPLNLPSRFEKEEKTFADIQAYLLSLEAPKYPFAVNKDLALKGEKLFNRNCAKCHGTYGENPTYPNRIVALDEIGTDPKRFEGISKAFNDHYNKSWFAKEKGEGYQGQITKGYQAPPLDGIWATAPCFHNGSVPTVYHVLNSKARPKIFTRSYETEKKDYDQEKLGWKITVLKKGADPKLPAWEQRKIYDTRLPGRSNKGHTFGDKLTDAERYAIIEYLKTL